MIRRVVQHEMKIIRLKVIEFSVKSRMSSQTHEIELPLTKVERGIATSAVFSNVSTVVDYLLCTRPSVNVLGATARVGIVPPVVFARQRWPKRVHLLNDLLQLGAH